MGNTLKVGQNGCDLGGINHEVHSYDGPRLAEHTLPKTEAVRYYEISVPAMPNGVIRFKLNLIDKEIGLDQGKNGFVIIPKNEVRKVAEGLLQALEVLEMGS